MKYLFEDRNNPICVGDSLSILNDKFAYKCKELFSNKYIEDKDDINKRNSVELQNIIRKQIELDKTHDEIEIILNSVERKNLLSVFNCMCSMVCSDYEPLPVQLTVHSTFSWVLHHRNW